MIETAIALKLAGGALIISSGALAGFFYSKKYDYREEQLLEMKKALTILKSEIRFQLTPFGEAAAAVSSKVKSPVSDIFSFSSENALNRNGGGAFEIWEAAVENAANDSYFNKGDIEAFKSLGKNLGYLDKEMQSQSISLIIEYIDAEVESNRENGAKQSKMYRSLGFLSGLLITVMLM